MRKLEACNSERPPFRNRVGHLLWPLGAAFFSFIASLASASQCPPSQLSNPTSEVRALIDQIDRKPLDQATIYDRYRDISNSNLPDFQAVSQQIASSLLERALAGLKTERPDSEQFRTALTVLSNLPTWRSCDTEGDVANIAIATKALVGRDDDAKVDLNAEASAAIQRAEGHLTPLLRKEHDSATEIDGTIARLQEILDMEALRGTEYAKLVESSLASKRQEALFWRIGFDVPFASMWAQIGDITKCPADNLSCIYLRDSSEQLDRILASLQEAKTSPLNSDYFVYNDFLLLRAMNHILAKQLDLADTLVRVELVEGERNSEANWYDLGRPLDHVYVYKFLRDPDDRGRCVAVELRDVPRDRCPVKAFFNPVQLGQALRKEIEELGQAAAAETHSPQALDSTLRKFSNHDYRVVLNPFESNDAPSEASLPDEIFAVLKEKDLVQEWCPADSRALTKDDTPAACLTAVELSPGNYEGYYFVGGDFTADKAKDIVDGITGRKRANLLLYLTRPPLKG